MIVFLTVSSNLDPNEEEEEVMAWILLTWFLLLIVNDEVLWLLVMNEIDELGKWWDIVVVVVGDKHDTDVKVLVMSWDVVVAAAMDAWFCVFLCVCVFFLGLPFCSI